MVSKNEVNDTNIELGPIPRSWKLTLLFEACLNITDGKHGDCENQENSGYYFISCKDIYDKKINYERARQITKMDFEETHKRTKLEANDVLLTNSGTIGRLAIARDNDLTQKTTFQKSVAVLKPDKKVIFPEFLYYSLLANKKRLIAVSGGTTQKNLLLKDIREFAILICDIDEQISISRILSDLDSKIELNQQMNKTLESIAQAIFKHWFINFEFPDENGQPYKSSGGEMVDSELGEIPKGWEVLTLGNLLSSIESGKRPKGGIDPDLKFGIPSIGAENISGLGYYDYSKTKFVSFEYFEGMKQGIVKDKDVLLYKDGAQIGRKTMFGCGFPFDKCCVNEHVFILRTNEKINQFFLFLWLNQDEVTRNIQNLNSNSAQPGLNRDSIKTLQVFVPHKDVLNNFEGVVSKLIGKIFLNSLNSRELSLIRDLLLPKLMSGKIRVPLEE